MGHAWLHAQAHSAVDREEGVLNNNNNINEKVSQEQYEISVRDGHGGGGSRKINAWHIYTLMVYL
jgi:hypothetical protein